jgi:tRNA (cmo5U34)-methyltransferase
MGTYYSPRSSGFRKIDSSEFFFVREDNYDEHAELAIPGYVEMHDALPWCVSDKEHVRQVLDLGCGTGKTSKVFLDAFPQCSVVGVDLFEEMLRRARAHLQPFGDRFSAMRGDVREVPFGEGRDVCVASLALHHLTAPEKREVFRKIFRCLAPGGRFLMIDWTKFDNPTIQEAAAAVAEAHVRKRVPNQHVVAEWVQHWREKNLPETVDDLTEWMRTAGFSSVECVMRNFGMALLMGEK